MTQRISAECAHAKPFSCGPFEKAINVDVVGMGSLQNALASLSKQTLITGGNRVVCEICSEESGDTVRRAFWEKSTIDRSSVSPMLVLNLKRFTVESQGSAANVKVNDFLSFPMVLDMGPYTSGPVASGEIDVKAPMGGPVAMEWEERPLVYHLVGVIVHKGEATHGHYYGLMKHSGSNKWYKVDDDNVTEYDVDQLPGEVSVVHYLLDVSVKKERGGTYTQG